jgi:EAL domain-containing protein (putative c-di-GMP-specific phosphodiesterase class I)
MTPRNQHVDLFDGPRPPALASSLASACVLVVDDAPVNVALLVRLLRSAGIENVHAVTDPREAVRRCQDVGADLVLLDLQMPHMDGFAVMDALRSALPGDAYLPVLVLTADAAGPTRDRALGAGANDFLTKPFERTEVLLRVHNLLQTRALYARVQRQNRALQADLDQRADRERRLAEERRRRCARIDAALTGDALRMVFQPIAALSTGEVLGAEALSRFSCEPHRPPNEWFAEAASVGRGAEVELAAVASAVAEVENLPDGAFVSVNVSASTATTPELADVLAPAPAPRIVLELTEHTRIDDYRTLTERLDPLRQRGVRIAVDDAGAGYSGLRHVLSLRPDILKLDIDLTRSIDIDPARRALATAMVSFSREIDAVIIAEGVETEAELDTLRGLGIPWAQGFHLAHPGPLPLPVTYPRIANVGD